VADALMPHIEVPVIGIGAGLATDGQVLVFHDLLGISTGSHSPRFVKRYAEIHERMVEGVRAYADEVRAQRFPDAEHVYSADPALVEEFKRFLETESLATAPWDW
jgi:3-methyl-2-oxobutanoate hydroxymethyltransferase